MTKKRIKTYTICCVDKQYVYNIMLCINIPRISNLVIKTSKDFSSQNFKKVKLDCFENVNDFKFGDGFLIASYVDIDLKY